MSHDAPAEGQPPLTPVPPPRYSDRFNLLGQREPKWKAWPLGRIPILGPFIALPALAIEAVVRLVKRSTGT